MRRLVYLGSARRNLLEIFEYIARESGSTEIARRFVGQLRTKCEDIARLPGALGRARPELRPDIRSAPFRSYVIFFRYTEGSVEIVNVLEGHRDIDNYFREKS